jgi:hypothetical protein
MSFFESRKSFRSCPDTAAVYARWRQIVTTLQITGKTAHDARIVAAMSVHGVSQILTFNAGDFSRYPGIAALDPASVAAPTP